MKSLRVYFVMSLVWLLAGLALVACSDKGKNGAPGACPAGYINNGGGCVWDSGQGGYGGTLPPGGNAFVKNGTIVNSSNFRDFNYRLFNYYKYCGYSYPYKCSDVQVKVHQFNGSQYKVYISSPSLSSGVALDAERFQYDGQAQEIFQIYYGNPYRYIIAELVVNQGLTATSSTYSLNYKDNVGYSPIVTGTMRKGFDYY